VQVELLQFDVVMDDEDVEDVNLVLLEDGACLEPVGVVGIVQGQVVQTSASRLHAKYSLRLLLWSQVERGFAVVIVSRIDCVCILITFNFLAHEALLECTLCGLVSFALTFISAHILGNC